MTDMLNVNQQSLVNNPVPIPKKSRPIKTDKPRPFLCSICTRGFVRHEHLKRHKISHTNEKPYLCIFCGRCFARKDLVLRHQYKLHPSLISKKEQEGENSTDNSNNNGNIVKVVGNKKTILPTPLNPLAMTAAELKRQNKIEKKNGVTKSKSKLSNKKAKTSKDMRKHFENGSDDIYITSSSVSPSSVSVSPQQSLPVPQESLKVPQGNFRKRHASFSASNVYTYRPNQIETEIPSRDDSEISADVPHQVGFSTPQLTTNKLLEKVFDSEFADNEMLQFSLDDPFFQNPSNENNNNYALLDGFDISGKPKLFNNNETTTNHNDNNNNSNSNSNNTNNNNNNNNSITNKVTSLDTIQENSFANFKLHKADSFLSSSFIPSASFLSLANLLTTSSIGQGGYSNNNIMSSNVGTNNHSSSMSNLFEYFSNDKNMNNILPSTNTTAGPMARSDSDLYQNSQITGNLIQNNNISNPLKANNDEVDEKWLSEFLTINPQFQNVDPNSFKLSSKHFNDIGFVSQNYSPSDESSLESAGVSPNLGSNHISTSTSTENTVSPLPDFDGKPNKSLPQYVINSNKDVRITNTNTPSKYFNSGRRNSIVTEFFNTRQHAVFHEDSMFLNNLLNSSVGLGGINSNSDVSNQNTALGTTMVNPLFNEDIRTYIISSNSLSPELFPSVDELNSYTKLYILKFHGFFPFVHIGSIDIKPDNYTFILSLTVIGALHSFHSSHAMLLSRICWTQIKNIINKLSQTHSYSETPIWVIQSMVLLIFINIFNNDLSLQQKKIIHTQLNTLVELIKVTKINLPLEAFEKPPIQSDHTMDYQDNPETLSKYLAQFETSDQIDKAFQYFIKAQQRIRTCHVFLIVSNMFTNMAGLECSFHSIDIRCGIPCYLTELFECNNSTEWKTILVQKKIALDSKFSLLELSNGGETYQNCLNYLANGNKFFFENEKLSLKTLLSLLIAVHEKIFFEDNKLSVYVVRNSLEGEMKWRTECKPIIDFAMKNWEALFIKNGGVLATADAESMSRFVERSPEALLIIPLHLLACIRKCVNITPVMNAIYLQDWEKLNRIMENKFFYCDLDSVHEASEYALLAINFWIDAVSVVNNAPKTSKRTPIFAIMSIFVAMFIIAEQMKRIEDWAYATNKTATPNSIPSVLKASDRIMWLRCEKVLKKIELHVLPKGYNKETYAEFLRYQAKGALDVEVLDDQLAYNAMQATTDINETAKVIQKARLSTRCLYLGVRILGDAPIWPIALLFAHALQSRAVYISKNFDKYDSMADSTTINRLLGPMNVETYYNSVLGSFNQGQYETQNHIQLQNNCNDQAQTQAQNMKDSNVASDFEDDGILRF